MSYAAKRVMHKEDCIKMANDRKAESEQIKAIITSKREQLQAVRLLSVSYSKLEKELQMLNSMYIEALSDTNRLMEYAESIKV